MGMNKSCGCHTGAFFALSAIIICVVKPPMSFATPLQTLLADFGFVLTAAIAGKITGIIGARVLFRRTEA
jgi:hypothetical protein